MTIRVNIKHDQETGERLLKVSVITFGTSPDAPQDVRKLEPGQETSVHVHGGQFVIVEETDSKEL